MTIDSFTVEQHTDVLASFIPVGRAYEGSGVDGSNLRRYLSASSEEFKRLQDLMATFLSELDPRTTENFITEWENAVGIPDSCIPIAATADERRDNIVLKLNALSVQTEQDYIDLAAAFGFTITFPPHNALPYTLPFGTEDPIVINALPFTLPFTLVGDPTVFTWFVEGDFDTDPEKALIFQCLVRLLIPVGYQVVFTNS